MDEEEPLNSVLRTDDVTAADGDGLEMFIPMAATLKGEHHRKPEQG